MSFKREGDDAALLRNLKMRRVGELLGDHIPDDEATLLSNGRLCCTMCSNRPIFDTLTTLAVHRKGKKHINELSKYLAHKRELEMKQLKIDQYKQLKEDIKVSQSTSCHKKTKKGPSQQFCRKTVLDVPVLSMGEQNQSSVPSAQSQVRHYLKDLWKKRALEKTVEKLRDNYGKNCPSVQKEIQPKLNDTKETVVESQKITRPKLDETKMKEAEHNLQLRMSGWIKDADGKWIKDPNVEFDSDEDEPTEPPS